MNKRHETVLLIEAVDALHVKNHSQYIDATLGAAGHTIEILKRGGNVLGIDTDSQMIEVAKDNIVKACPPHKRNVMGRFKLVKGNFRDIQELAAKNNIDKVDGIVFDLGVSNLHFEDDKRGFSFNSPNAALDMRLDPKSQSVTAADLLNSLRPEQLFEMFKLTNDYRKAKRLRDLIVIFREYNKYETVKDLLNALDTLKSSKGNTHHATTAFLALRIAVNDELGSIPISIKAAVKLLNSGGYLSVITFHSSEDAIVKNLFRDMSKKGEVTVETKKPITPSAQELRKNKKSRSSKLRIIKKL